MLADVKSQGFFMFLNEMGWDFIFYSVQWLFYCILCEITL